MGKKAKRRRRRQEKRNDSRAEKDVQNVKAETVHAAKEIADFDYEKNAKELINDLSDGVKAGANLMSDILLTAPYLIVPVGTIYFIKYGNQLYKCV